MNNDLAPIVLFVYKRLEHTILTLEGIAGNKLASETDLFIFSDGPKDVNDLKAVESVREYLKTVRGFRSIKIKESMTNNGLANSIISGVTSVLQTNDKAIILEDDMITSSDFLAYMNMALDYYKDDKRIFQISGYIPPMSYSNTSSTSEIFFLPRINSWGWAIWSDRWKTIDWNLRDFKTFITSRSEIRKFQRGGKDKLSVLIGAYSGFNDVWAIKCDYGRYKFNDALVVYPRVSKIKNIGSDGSGTHKEKSSRFDVDLIDTNKSNFKFSTEISIDPSLLKQFDQLYKVSSINKAITYFSFRLGIYRYLKSLKSLLRK